MVIRFNTKLFSYDKASKIFVAELSTLQGNYQGPARLIDIMAGFELESERTGATEHVHFVRTEYCGTEDHEIVAWHFVASGSVPFGLVIFND